MDFKDWETAHRTEKLLNELGKQGWEVCGIAGHRDFKVVLKRNID
jgi:hypothetical protein